MSCADSRRHAGGYVGTRQSRIRILFSQAHMKNLQGNKKTCRQCGAHRACFEYDGRVRWDRQHDVCPRCFRALVNKARALRMQSHPSIARVTNVPEAA